MFGLLNKVVRSPKSRDSDGAKGAITVLLNDGQVLQFPPRRLKCSGLLASHPNHTVCHASALVLHQQMKVLAPEAYMEPGEIYFLVPKPASRTVGKRASSAFSESSSLLESAPGPAAGARSGSLPVKFVISKQYLSRILAEGNATRPALKRSETNVWNQQPDPRHAVPVRRARSTGSPWSGPLDSIAEVAS